MYDGIIDFSSDFPVIEGFKAYFWHKFKLISQICMDILILSSMIYVISLLL